MKIKIVGAAGGEVTGSAYDVQTKRASVLVDCGLFQGGKQSEALNRPPTTSKQKIDAVLLTHGHLDHTGRLPMLARRGHTMPVFATPATMAMTALITRDSARIQTSDNERRNRRRARAGEPPQEPLYTPEDAEKILQRLRPVPYQKPVSVAPGIQAIWAESGHMLGSASIQLIVEEDGMTRFVAEKPLRADLKTMKLCASAEDSMKINDQPSSCLVMAGAGMCNAGRILHHLKANLWKSDTHVLVVGYQGDGSLGRRLVNGEKFVGIHGEKIAVKAQVHTLGGFSAHAGQTDLLTWLSAIAPSKPRVILTHGEDGPREALAQKIHQRFKLRSTLPNLGDAIEL